MPIVDIRLYRDYSNSVVTKETTVHYSFSLVSTTASLINLTYTKERRNES
jgi:hypothetical protein